MTIYLSGPMTGYPEYNEKLFASVSYILKERGFKVVNPHDLPPPSTLAGDEKKDWW